MQITWTNCTDKMPPDDVYIVKSKSMKLFRMSKMNLHEARSINRIYDDLILTRYTQEKWEYLNK